MKGGIYRPVQTPAFADHLIGDFRVDFPAVYYVGRTCDELQEARDAMADAIEQWLPGMGLLHPKRLTAIETTKEYARPVRILFHCGRAKEHQHGTPELARLCRKGQEPVT